MADGANQHYVPQFYFRGFSADGRSICVLNRGDGNTIPVASIRGQASKKYFYGNAEAENRLQTIDGAFSTVVKRLREHPNFEDFSADDYYLLLQMRIPLIVNSDSRSSWTLRAIENIPMPNLLGHA